MDDRGDTDGSERRSVRIGWLIGLVALCAWGAMLYAMFGDVL